MWELLGARWGWKRASEARPKQSGNGSRFVCEPDADVRHNCYSFVSSGSQIAAVKQSLTDVFFFQHF